MKVILIASPEDPQEVQLAQSALTAIREKCPQIGNNVYVVSAHAAEKLFQQSLDSLSLAAQIRIAPTEELLTKVLSGNQFKTNSTRPDFDKHLLALQNASIAALEADPQKDGGTCNFDSVVIWLKGWKAEDVKELQKLSGVSIGDQKTSRWWRGARSLDFGKGQGFRRTVMAEAAAKVLKAAGIECSMFYQVD